MPRAPSTWLLLVALFCIIFSANAQVNYFYVIPWDASVYSSQNALQVAISTTLSKCIATDRPLFQRLQGGLEINQPRLWVRLQTVTAFEGSACFQTLLTTFPGMSSTAQNLSNIGFCYIDGKGFATGLEQCPILYGNPCGTGGICATGSKCDSTRLCSIDPQFYKFTFTYSAPMDNITARDNIRSALVPVAALVAEGQPCAGVIKAYQVLSVTANGSVDTSKFDLLTSIDANSFPDSCKNAVVGIVPAIPAATPPVITFTSSRITNVPRPCYTLDPTGYVTAFDIENPKCSSITVPIGGICGGNQVCPGSSSACGKVEPNDNVQVCLTYNIADVVANRQIASLTYTAGLAITNAAYIRDDYKKKVEAGACIPASGSWLSNLSSTIIAVDGSSSKWKLIFYLDSADPIPPACISQLTAIDSSTTPDMILIEFNALTTTDLPSFSCITVTVGATANLSLAGFVCGGRCDWNCALGEICNLPADCDETSEMTCSSIATTTGSKNVCTKPNLIPSASTVTIARIDVDSDGYLGNSYGTQRLALFIDKLKPLCPQFTSWTFAIGNANYSRANVWLAPFDYTLCTQQLVQVAASQASNTVITANQVDLLTGEDIVASTFLLSSIDMDDYEEIIPGDHNDHDQILFNLLADEPPAEPTPTPTPVTVIPRLRYASIKTFNFVAKPKCISDTSVLCISQDADCQIPCGYAAPCSIDQQCGSFGKCNSAICTQRGTSYVKPNSAIQLQLGLALTLFCVLALFF